MQSLALYRSRVGISGAPFVAPLSAPGRAWLVALLLMHLLPSL